MKIKYCGLRREEDITYANETLPDYIGFVFAPTRRQVSVKQAEVLKKRLKPEIKAVGVFVNETVEDVAEIANRGIIDLIQLHGQENADYITRLRKILFEPKPIIKAVRVQSLQDIEDGDKLDVDYLLLDKYDPKQLGGTGEKFDWSLIQKIRKPFFLAGGITEDNLIEAMELNPYGIDVSSGIETEGMKDYDKMKMMMNLFRQELKLKT